MQRSYLQLARYFHDALPMSCGFQWEPLGKTVYIERHFQLTGSGERPSGEEDHRSYGSSRDTKSESLYLSFPLFIPLLSFLWE